MQRWDKPTDRVQRVDEKQGKNVYFRVMVIKM